MLSDDVYRSRLSAAIETLEAWADAHRDCAQIEAAATPTFWKMVCRPDAIGACPFDLMLRADQRFSAQIGNELYEDKPIDTLDFFPMLVRAIASGNVERIDVSNALTGALEAIETRATLEDGWAWIGERRIGRGIRRNDTQQELRSHRFLPYRRPPRAGS
jgi:hypothetical protein